jgi:hypothetical protein
MDLLVAVLRLRVGLSWYMELKSRIAVVDLHPSPNIRIVSNREE